MKRSLSKDEVRSALSAYIARHAADDRLPPLRTLSRELGVSIYLIRKHLNAMQREGILRTRNRIGLFLTPEEVRRPAVGIISNPESSFPFIDAPDMYAGLISALSKQFCLVRCINFKTVSDLPKLVKSLGLAGVAWVRTRPEFDDFPALMELLVKKHHIPVSFCGQNIYPVNDFKRLSNIVSLDWEELARLRAEYFVAHGKTRIVYFSPETGPACPIFKKHLAGFGIDLPKECVISRFEQLEQRLPDLIRRYGIDGILVDGSPGFYEALFAFLHREPSFRPLVSIEDYPQVRCLLRRYPDIKLDFQFESSHDFHFRMGVRTAGMLTDAMSDGLIRKPEKYCPEIVDQKFLKWKKDKK